MELTDEAKRRCCSTTRGPVHVAYVWHDQVSPSAWHLERNACHPQSFGGKPMLSFWTVTGQTPWVPATRCSSPRCGPRREPLSMAEIKSGSFFPAWSMGSSESLFVCFLPWHHFVLGYPTRGYCPCQQSCFLHDLQHVQERFAVQCAAASIRESAPPNLTPWFSARKWWMLGFG